ncbi:hypothetical protein ACJJTC_014257 [Scirpophaga incertulas]
MTLYERKHRAGRTRATAVAVHECGPHIVSVCLVEDGSDALRTKASIVPPDLSMPTSADISSDSKNRSDLQNEQLHRKVSRYACVEKFVNITILLIPNDQLVRSCAGAPQLPSQRPQLSIPFLATL